MYLNPHWLAHTHTLAHPPPFPLYYRLHAKPVLAPSLPSFCWRPNQPPNWGASALQLYVSGASPEWRLLAGSTFHCVCHPNCSRLISTLATLDDIPFIREKPKHFSVTHFETSHTHFGLSIEIMSSTHALGHTSIHGRPHLVHWMMYCVWPKQQRLRTGKTEPIPLKSTLRILLFWRYTICWLHWNSSTVTLSLSLFLSYTPLSLTHTDAESFFILFFYFTVHTHPLRIMAATAREGGGRWWERDRATWLYKYCICEHWNYLL